MEKIEEFAHNEESYSLSDGSNSLSDFHEIPPLFPLNSISIFQQPHPELFSSKSIPDVPNEVESEMEAFLYSSASMAHDIITEVLQEVMNAVHESELKKERDSFISKETHVFFQKAVDTFIVQTEDPEEERGQSLDIEPEETIMDSWASFTTCFSKKRNFPTRKTLCFVSMDSLFEKVQLIWRK